MQRLLFFAATALALIPLSASAAYGSPYQASNIGYDLSYGTYTYPAANYGFAVVGVSNGRAFTRNPRLATEYSWAQFGGGSAPTFYMNLNAPYGSFATTANTSGPSACAATSTPISATSSEPTPCAGYNFGYNAAKNAVNFVKGNGSGLPLGSLWWLDIETDNSWSKNLAVNQATIQGAMDYLNSQGIRAGVYSMTAMWKQIAGAGYAPQQVVNGQSVTTPIWLALGIDTQIGALNECATWSPFIPGSPLWLVQYEANANAIDQNIAC